MLKNSKGSFFQSSRELEQITLQDEFLSTALPYLYKIISILKTLT